MPRTRIPVTISFPTKEDHQDAIRKARNRGRTLSGQIQEYFKQLPEHPVETIQG